MTHQRSVTVRAYIGESDFPRITVKLRQNPEDSCEPPTVEAAIIAVNNEFITLEVFQEILKELNLEAGLLFHEDEDWCDKEVTLIPQSINDPDDRAYGETCWEISEIKDIVEA